MIDKLININRIKFSILDQIFGADETSIFSASKKGNQICNIHIDLHSVLEALYTSRNYTETNWTTESNIEISSCIINLAAHYRLYAAKYGMAARVFLYFGNERPRNNTQCYDNYGYKYFDKYQLINEDYKPVNKAVSYNLKLVKTICEYIPAVYYIDCKYIEPMIACAYNILSHKESNIVLTKDPLWYQLVSINNSNIIRLKRDESFLITKDNLFDIILDDSSYNSKSIPSDMLSIIYSFGGIKTRDIKGLSGYGYVKISKILNLAIERGLIKAKYTHIKNIMDEIYSGNKEDELTSIFRSIDMQYQLNQLTSGQKEIIKNCIIDKYNRRDMLKLNQTIYTGEHSLMLDELFRCANVFDSFKW